jgi:hypothetical protein
MGHVLTDIGYNFNAHPGLPLINVGTLGKPIYIVAEWCTLVQGQSLKTKLSSLEQDGMIKFACRSPPENAESVTSSARQLLGLDNNKLLVSLAHNVVDVAHGRILTSYRMILAFLSTRSLLQFTVACFPRPTSNTSEETRSHR